MAGNQAWIQDSLARLEQLESQREQLATSGRADQLAELDEEIRSLYEALESAADDSEDDGAANGSPQVSAAQQGWASPAAEVPHPAFGPAPVAVVDVAAAPASPFAAAPAPAPSFTPTPMPDYGSSSSGDEELSTGGKGGVVAVALVVLVALGGGGWWYLNRTQADAPKPQAPVGEAKVIGASEIPPDTQDPNVAKGGNADRTPAQIIKERQAAEEARRPSRPSSGASSSKPREPEKPTRGPIKVGSSDDPLAGVK